MSERLIEAPLEVAVLAGGDSAERSISRSSGIAVTAALQSAGHRPTLLDPARCRLEGVDWRRFDACFIALHGGAGEDGRIQSRLERLGMPYTGSRPAACRLAMSKSASKERFGQSGVPTAPTVLFHADEPLTEVTRRISSLTYPLVVKPDSQGSSLGVSRVRGPDDLTAAVGAARRFDSFLIAEPAIKGRELTVAILGRQSLPALEIIAEGELFDYDAKYQSPRTQYRFDTDLSADVIRRIERIAVRAAEVLETRGLVRVDLMLDQRLRPSVLEVNTIPGMTQNSLAPMAAAHAGIDMSTLCEVMLTDCQVAEVVG